MLPPKLCRQRVADIAFIGEIEPRLDLGAQIEQLIAPAVDALRQAALEPRQGLAPLVLGFRLEQIAETFDLDQVELAVLEGAAGELTGFRQARALDW